MQLIDITLVSIKSVCLQAWTIQTHCVRDWKFQVDLTGVYLIQEPSWSYNFYINPQHTA